jgi:hypothetical protein
MGLALMYYNKQKMLLMDFSSMIELLSDIQSHIPDIEKVIKKAN